MSNPSIQRDLFPGHPTPSQAEVMAIVQPHSDFLVRSVYDPYQGFLQRRATDRDFADLEEDQAAQWITMQATHRARGFFDGRQGVRLMTVHRKLLIVIDERLAITIKKLTVRRINDRERITRSNYLTRRNRRFHNQQIVEDAPSLPRVMLGYIFRKELTEIEIYMAYARTRCRLVEWVTPLSLQQPVAFVPQVATPAEEQPARGFSIGPVEQTDRIGADRPTGTDAGAE